MIASEKWVLKPWACSACVLGACAGERKLAAQKEKRMEWVGVRVRTRHLGCCALWTRLRNTRTPLVSSAPSPRPFENNFSFYCSWISFKVPCPFLSSGVLLSLFLGRRKVDVDFSSAPFKLGLFPLAVCFCKLSFREEHRAPEFSLAPRAQALSSVHIRRAAGSRVVAPSSSAWQLALTLTFDLDIGRSISEWVAE